MRQSSLANLSRCALFVSVFLAVLVSFQSSNLDIQWDHLLDDYDPLSPLLSAYNLSSYHGGAVPKTSTANQTWDGSFEISDRNQTGTSQYCQTPACWKTLALSLGLKRAFPDRHSQRWLVQGKSTEPLMDPSNPNHTYSDAGIIYVKNFKAASSTIAGVALRLAFRLPGNDTTSNGWVRFHHTPGYSYRNRNPARSFLFTSVRDPARRALSRIFYTHISQFGHDPHNEDLLLDFLKSTDLQYGSVRHVGGGYQVWYASLNGDQLPRSWGAKRPTTVQRRPIVHHVVGQILQDYDFLMVAERLNESIVVMALLMNVSLDDVLVQNAKDSTAVSWYYIKSGKLERCKRPIKVVQTPRIRDHLQSETWLAKNYGDYLLHAAADLSLDATIDRLGRDRVTDALETYQNLQDQVAAACQNQTIYHCSAEGVPQRPQSRRNCYSDDSGCGYQCIDAFLSHLPQPKTARIF